MPLVTYEDVRPWARAIKTQVLTRHMPKWSAAHGYGAFANDPSLTPIEMAMIAAWVDGGQPRSAKEGSKSSSPSAGATRAASAFGGDAVRLIVAAGATDEMLRSSVRWVGGWEFEPGDALITSATFSSADGTRIGTWVAGDGPVTLRAGSAIRVWPPVQVQLQRRKKTDYEKASSAKPSTLTLQPRTETPLRRVWVEETACGRPRTSHGADLLAVRPLVGDRVSVRMWLERPGAPRFIVGWFRDIESLYPRTFWLARPVELTPESRIAADVPCMAELTLAAR